MGSYCSARPMRPRAVEMGEFPKRSALLETMTVGGDVDATRILGGDADCASFLRKRCMKCFSCVADEAPMERPL